jgi:hypothetical protein
MIEYLFLILAFPLGFLLASLTKHEKNIYSKKQYFPSILVILAILAAVTFSIDKSIFLTTTFMFITTLVWLKA